MRLHGQANRLTIVVGEDDRVPGGGSLAAELVKRAQAQGLAGVTVLRGVEGYGESNALHTSRLLALSSDLPIVLFLVDEPDRIEAFLGTVDGLIGAGLVIVEPVDVRRYGHEGRLADPGAGAGADGPA